MKSIIVLSLLMALVQLSSQTALVDSECNREDPEVKKNLDNCLHINCPGGEARVIGCMNDVCPPGKHPMGRLPGDNTKAYPGCCGQLNCMDNSEDPHHHHHHHH